MKKSHTTAQDVMTSIPWYCVTHVAKSGVTKFVKLWILQFKSDVWKHFGFHVSKNATGEKVTNTQKTGCRHC